MFTIIHCITVGAKNAEYLNHLKLDKYMKIKQLIFFLITFIAPIVLIYLIESITFASFDTKNWSMDYRHVFAFISILYILVMTLLIYLHFLKNNK